MSAPPEARYVLGHDEAELRRLEHASQLYAPLTDPLFAQCGIEPGDTVLDLGCGPGDVSLLIGRLVGPSGRVIGIDRSSEAVDTARRRAAAAGLTQVAFECVDIDDYTPPVALNAITGRFVMMYQPDPAATLRRLAGHLRPDGVVCLQEMNMSTVHSQPMSPLVEKMIEWVRETFRRAGHRVDQGGELHRVFRRAGLPAPQLRAGSAVEANAPIGVVGLLIGVTSVLLPAMISLGVATAEQVGLDDATPRLLAEIEALDAMLFGPTLVGAYATVS